MPVGRLDAVVGDGADHRGRLAALAGLGAHVGGVGLGEDAILRSQLDHLAVLRDEDLPALYAHAAVFVQPSSYEGFGLTAAEAHAFGLVNRVDPDPEAAALAGIDVRRVTV